MYLSDSHPPASAEPIAAPHVRRSSTFTLSPAVAALLGQFTSDVRAAAISCVNLLSCFNSVGFSKAIRLPMRIAEFAPAPMPSLAALADSPLLPMLSPATRAGLRGFEQFLVQGREELERVLALHQAKGSVRREDVDKACDVINTAACFAKITLKDLSLIHARLFNEFDVAQLNYLASLLDDVLQGKCPLLADGKLIGVRTDFQMRERRVEIHAEALVVNTSEVRRVVVCNISQGGLGFVGEGEFELGQSLEIKLLDSGRRLNGRLAWRIGTKAGVAFARLLKEDDPLLQP